MDIEKALDNLAADSETALKFCEDSYNSHFGDYFSEARDMFKRLASKTRPITNEELQWILIDLPIKLFEVSEKLNSFRVLYEVAKINLKQREIEVGSDDTAKSMKATERKEYVAAQTAGDKIIITLYDSIIDRVEREISYCRELIMGAKKVWDSRFKTDIVNPISEVSENLPSYTETKSKSYVHGA